MAGVLGPGDKAFQATVLGLDILVTNTLWISPVFISMKIPDTVIAESNIYG